MIQRPLMFSGCLSLEGRIDCEDARDCERWARYFNVTTERLHDAIRAVGTAGDEVRRFLGKDYTGIWKEGEVDWARAIAQPDFAPEGISGAGGDGSPVQDRSAS